MAGWPEQRTHIGSNRIDAPAKVTGAAKYTADATDGWLYGMILRSMAEGKITSVNLTRPAKFRHQPPSSCATVNARSALRRRTRRRRRYTKQACLDALRVIEVEATAPPASSKRCR
jgi:hypothetical protein